jgi:hypothetical protein
MIENGVPTICERCQGRDEEQYDPDGLRRLLDALAER